MLNPWFSIALLLSLLAMSGLASAGDPKVRQIIAPNDAFVRTGTDILRHWEDNELQLQVREDNDHFYIQAAEAWVVKKLATTLTQKRQAPVREQLADLLRPSGYEVLLYRDDVLGSGFLANLQISVVGFARVPATAELLEQYKDPSGWRENVPQWVALAYVRAVAKHGSKDLAFELVKNPELCYLQSQSILWDRVYSLDPAYATGQASRSLKFHTTDCVRLQAARALLRHGNLAEVEQALPFTEGELNRSVRGALMEAAG